MPMIRSDPCRYSTSFGSFAMASSLVSLPPVSCWATSFGAWERVRCSSTPWILDWTQPGPAWESTWAPRPEQALGHFFHICPSQATSTHPPGHGTSEHASGHGTHHGHFGRSSCGDGYQPESVKPWPTTAIAVQRCEDGMLSLS